MTHICKSHRIKVRQQSNHLSNHKSAKPLPFTVNPDDPMVLILCDGTRLRQPIEGLGLYCSEQGRFYSLTRFGLREIKVHPAPKNNYCKRVQHGPGHHQGQHYPHVCVGGKQRPAHHLMILAWRGRWDKSIEQVDHINGDINNFSISNLRVIDIPENDRCGGILRRLRNASVRLNEPRLNPVNIPQERLLHIFSTVRIPKSGRVNDSYLLNLLD